MGSSRKRRNNHALMHAREQELVHINVVKGIKDTFGAKSFMGRAAVPIRPYADKPGETVEDWIDLGKGEWSNEDGTVRAHCLICASLFLGSPVVHTKCFLDTFLKGSCLPLLTLCS